MKCLTTASSHNPMSRKPVDIPRPRTLKHDKKLILRKLIHITIHLLHLQWGLDQEMNVGNSRTPNEHAVVHWDCPCPEISRKSKDVPELVRHNRMLRSHCLESELDMDYAFKHNETIVKTCLRVPKNPHFGIPNEPSGGPCGTHGLRALKNHPAITFLGHHLGSFWTHKNKSKLM